MSTRAKIRADFIKRLFAVAISIGMATSFVRMGWVQQGSWPTPDEWQQLMVLATGLFATVLSWDGYLASIAEKPLNGYLRYAIDIILVFIYMFFLISAAKPYLWLPTLALIFLLYVAWDFLTVREHMPSYDASLVPAAADENYRAPLTDVFRVYTRGLINAPGTERGPIISLSWAIFFLGLAILNYKSSVPHQTYVMCATAILALWLYRHDKATKIGAANVHGYGMFTRGLIIVALLAIVALYLCYESSRI